MIESFDIRPVIQPLDVTYVGDPWHRPPTLIPSTLSIPWPTCSVPSPPLTAPSRIAAVDQLPTPSAEPDAEGATSQLPPINPTAEITSEGRGRKRSTEEVTTVYEEGKIIEAEGEASVVVGATVKEGEAVGVVVVSEL
ncbi:hypothetical protein GBA52_024909 [Prunus armeniaca]|nr:hypothetical protein GBA52_024909 [Prunus armeniaca]